ncbi:DHHA1 domain-containing protein [Streptomyces sp. NPDC004728]|uniref:DHHA1 domain-containing protein n=1 Tax=Streptomyces sp. NPDC004728 TaxID=3154289 RepID=UPI0033B3F3FB
MKPQSHPDKALTATDSSRKRAVHLRSRAGGPGRPAGASGRRRATGLAGLAVDSNGIQVVTATTDGGADEARALATAVRDRLPVGAPGAVGLGTDTGIIVVALNKAGRETGLNAASLVKQLLTGRGGGSPELAQGGGPPADRLAGTLTELPRLVRRR